MLLDLEEEDYPPGEVNELAVCYIVKSEKLWSFEPAADRSIAEQLFQRALKAEDVHTVLADGRPSAVVWIAKCAGEDDWVRIKPTKGAEIYLSYLATYN